MKIPNFPIEVFDDEVDFNTRHHIYNTALHANYRIVGWQDSIIPETQWKYDMHSKWSIDDLKLSGLYPHVERHAKGKQIVSTICNVVRAGDTYYNHCHKDQTIFLYYANLKWQDGWHGETLFYDNKGEEIVYTSKYTPGRIIVFSDNQVHSIRPQSHTGPQFRFTVTAVLEEPKNEQQKAEALRIR